MAWRNITWSDAEVKLLRQLHASGVKFAAIAIHLTRLGLQRHTTNSVKGKAWRMQLPKRDKGNFDKRCADMVINLARPGRTDRYIAKVIGVSPVTVCRIRGKLGIPRGVMIRDIPRMKNGRYVSTTATGR